MDRFPAGLVTGLQTVKTLNSRFSDSSHITVLFTKLAQHSLRVNEPQWVSSPKSKDREAQKPKLLNLDKRTLRQLHLLFTLKSKSNLVTVAQER